MRIPIVIILIILLSTQVYAQPEGFYSFAVYQKSKGELRIFDNHYQEFRTNGINSIFNTLWLEGLYAPHDNFNIGLRLKARKVVKKEGLNISDLFKNYNGIVENTYQRLGLTAFQVAIRHHASKSDARFSWQHQITIPLGNDLEGNEYIDWNGWSGHSQLFFSEQINKYSLFVEIGILGENIQSKNFQKGTNFFSFFAVPVSVLPGFQISKKHFAYILLQYTTRWAVVSSEQWNFNPFGSAGLGYKYFINEHWEIEGIVSRFQQCNPAVPAMSLNLGLRHYY